MLDKNGIEMKTGDIVRIEGAYCKNDCGIWFIEASEGDPITYGKGHTLRKLNRNGTISKAKYSLCFWPIFSCTPGRFRRMEANAWNNEHATIEAITDTGISKKHIVQYFQRERDEIAEGHDWRVWNFGESSEIVKRDNACMAFYDDVIARIAREEKEV